MMFVSKKTESHTEDIWVQSCQLLQQIKRKGKRANSKALKINRRKSKHGPENITYADRHGGIYKISVVFSPYQSVSKEVRMKSSTKTKRLCSKMHEKRRCRRTVTAVEDHMILKLSNTTIVHSDCPWNSVTMSSAH